MTYGDAFHQTTERLTELFVAGKIKYDEITPETALFDHEHLDYQLPLRALTQEQIDYVDPERLFFNGEYNDLFVNLPSKGGVEFQLNADSKTTVFPVPTPIVDNFRYKVKAYDNDGCPKGQFFLCGFTNDLNTAIAIAELAYQYELNRKDVNREGRGVPDIDEIRVYEDDDLSLVGVVSWLNEEPCKNKFAFVNEPRYSLDSVIDIIRDMGSNEHITLNEYLGDVFLVITKDPDFNRNRNTVIFDMRGEEYMNLVTVDFQLNGKSIASTSDIHVDDLEDVLNAIRNGDTSYLIDEDKPLTELVKNSKKERNREEEYGY